MGLLERLGRAMLWLTAVVLLDCTAEAWLTVVQVIDTNTTCHLHAAEKIGGQDELVDGR